MAATTAARSLTTPFANDAIRLELALASHGSRGSGTSPEANDLTGKVFLVTGASTGIGAAVAIALADQGASVAVHYHASADAAARVTDVIKEAGGTAFLVGGDVTEYEACCDIVQRSADHFGKIDGLINNAGCMRLNCNSLDVRSR